MRANADLEIEVSRRTAADAGAALPREPDLLTFVDAGGNAHAQRARLHAQFTLGGKLRRAQLDHACAAAIRILEIDLDPGHVVLPRRREVLAARGARATEGAARTKQLREEVAELRGALVAWSAASLPAAPARELEALAPIGRRPEIL